MNTIAFPRQPESERRLWLGILLAPTAWALHSMLGYWLAARSCAASPVGWGILTDTGLSLILSGIAAVMLLVALTGLALSIQSWRGNEAGEGNIFDAEGRNRANFLAMFGLISSAVFATGLLYNVIAPLLLQPCVHTA